MGLLIIQVRPWLPHSCQSVIRTVGCVLATALMPVCQPYSWLRVSYRTNASLSAMQLDAVSYGSIK